MKIPFTKMHGLGNNYIYIDGFETKINEELLPQLSQAVSDVNTGIGSDGLILMLPSTNADVRMRIFNKDGSEAMNCGNGLRCVAKLAYDSGYVPKEQFQIEAKSGVVEAEVVVIDGIVEQVTIDMGEPILQREQIPMVTANYTNETVINEKFPVGDQDLFATAVSMGNPHVIFYVEDINDAPIDTVGPEVTSDARFPEGVNVEFVEVLNDHEINFRVWERGSGITQACGTGACASVVASVLNNYVKRGESVTVHLDGGDLTITWEENGHVMMKGPAVNVAEGIYFLKT
ncbi:diaminopimelate epimerase [Tenuibacillus multivorans]|uniref:Diaminopimelate epimerase n=1 Tax=Tenuibacillus multivorans TaxID=237069 RepID=A0A1H0FT49_9BACI|nr:diaminopimelate epimerase [Tenuibacillus multivorans]GEL77891.1 diaminopimelate epimerase [Tenuibacillus multivorans]SDN97848.1 diaminopimelate epimerase [Tenuibacillus multivorans]